LRSGKLSRDPGASENPAGGRSRPDLKTATFFWPAAGQKPDWAWREGPQARRQKQKNHAKKNDRQKKKS
jgi:hypothetical protein